MTVNMGERGSGQDCEDVQQSDFIMSDIMVVKRRWLGNGGHGRVELSQNCGDVQQFDFIMSGIMKIEGRWWGNGGHRNRRAELSQDCGDVQQSDFIMSGYHED